MSLKKSGDAGLLVMPCDTHGGSMVMTHKCNIPAPCCPISKNPKAGSSIAFTYIPNGWVIEVYSLDALMKEFQGGYKGNDHYPAERNMEGMCQLLCRMVSDAVGLPVTYRADIILDCGGMVLTGECKPL